MAGRAFGYNLFGKGLGVMFRVSLYKVWNQQKECPFKRASQKGFLLQSLTRLSFECI
jgi:hypothetical protein